MALKVSIRMRWLCVTVEKISRDEIEDPLGHMLKEAILFDLHNKRFTVYLSY